MKVIICGAGQVGWQIARHLSGEQNDVTVVDSNPDLVRRATDTLDVQGIAGFASYPRRSRPGRRARCGHDHRRDPFRRGQHGHLPGGPFGLRDQPQDRPVAGAILSRRDLFRSLPPRPSADRRGDHARARGGRRRRCSGSRHRPPSTPRPSWAARLQLLGIAIDEDCPLINTPLRQLTDLFSTQRATVVGIRREGTLFAPELERPDLRRRRVATCSPTPTTWRAPSWSSARPRRSRTASSSSAAAMSVSRSRAPSSRAAAPAPR